MYQKGKIVPLLLVLGGVSVDPVNAARPLFSKSFSFDSEGRAKSLPQILGTLPSCLSARTGSLPTLIEEEVNPLEVRDSIAVSNASREEEEEKELYLEEVVLSNDRLQTARVKAVEDGVDIPSLATRDGIDLFLQYQELPPLKQLTRLKFESLGWDYLPDWIVLAPLQELSVEDKVRKLPKGLRHVKTLKKLDVRGLKDFPNLDEMPQIEHLTLRDFKGSKINIKRGALKYLRTLDITSEDRCLKHIGKGIGGCPFLQKLSLEGGHLSHLPPTLAHIDGLKHVSLDGNAFRRIPSVFGRMPTLEEISMMDNPLQERPDWLSAKIDLKVSPQGNVKTGFKLDFDLGQKLREAMRCFF